MTWNGRGNSDVSFRPTGIQRTESKQPLPITASGAVAVSGGQSLYTAGTDAQVVFDPSTGVIVARDRQTGRIIVAHGKSKSDKGPIPDGNYEILETQRNDRFLRLDAVDRQPRNDVVEFEGGERFTSLRLHVPGGTLGCIALDTQKNWEAIQTLIMSSTPMEVKDNSTVREFEKVQFEIPDPLGLIDSGKAVKRGELTVGRMTFTPQGQHMSEQDFSSLIDLGTGGASDKQEPQRFEDAPENLSRERLTQEDRPIGIPR